MDASTSAAESQQAKDQPQQMVTEVQEQDAGSSHEDSSSSGGGSSGSSQRPRWQQRLIRYSIATIQALLLLELTAIVVHPLMPKDRKTKSGSGSEDSDDFDPADILMDYFTGRRGLSALQLLSNKQLRQAVDNLVTEDFQELGVKDRGAEIRDIVEEIIKVREEGPRPAPKPERVGLGKVGPLRFKNARRSAKPADAAAAAADVRPATEAAAEAAEKPS